jgi:RNA polymerase sigma-70 factor, ECF subfamily
MVHTNPKTLALSDGELIEKFRQTHDPEIIGALYKPYMYLVYGLCLKYLKNREDCQDAVMQVFEIVLKDVLRFEIRNFKSWLYSVSRNYCLMQLRRLKGEHVKMDEIGREWLMESTELLHPIEATDNEALQENLRQCLEQLREEQRRCVELFYYSQHCYKEISGMLEMAENQVKSHIQNGKRNLKLCIESKNAD